MLDDTDRYRKEVSDQVFKMHALGIKSIPVLVFEVAGITNGSWLEDRPSHGRELHQGSGNKAEFRAIFEKLHKETAGFGVLGYRWYNQTSLDLYLTTGLTLHLDSGYMAVTPTGDTSAGFEEATVRRRKLFADAAASRHAE